MKRITVFLVMALMLVGSVMATTISNTESTFTSDILVNGDINFTGTLIQGSVPYELIINHPEFLNETEVNLQFYNNSQIDDLFANYYNITEIDDFNFSMATSINWSDILNIPSDIADGDDDTQLSEAQVDTFVSNNNFINTSTYPNLDTDSTDDLTVDGNFTVTGDWSFANSVVFQDNIVVLGNVTTANVTNINIDGGFTPALTNVFDIGSPSQIWMSVYATTLYGNLNWSYLTGIPANLDLDSTDDFDGNFTSLTGVPTGLLDGDNDSFADLSCSANQVLQYNGTSWECIAPLMFNDTTLNESQVDAFVSNNGYLTGFNETDPIWSAVSNNYYNKTEVDNFIQSANMTILGNETIFDGWDKNESDDFDGVFSSLSSIPTGLSDGDNDTQLSESQVDSFVSNNGYLVSGGNISADNIVANDWTNVTITESQISDLVHTIDTDTTLNESQVDSFVSNNGYFDNVSFPNLDTDSTDDFNGSWNALTDIPLDIADGDNDTQLSESQVDSFVSNNGYVNNTYLSNNYYNTTETENLIANASIDGNDATFDGWDKNESDDFDGVFSSLSSIPTGLSDGDNDTTYENLSEFANDVGYLTSFTETDPVFSASFSSSITASNASDWNNAFSWGDHSLVGYLTSFTETDPLFIAWGYNWNNLTNVPSGFADGVDNDTQLSESQVDSFVSNNGYATNGGNASFNTITANDWTNITITESQISDLAHTIDTDTQLNESQVDSFVSNNGYLTSGGNASFNTITANDWTNVTISESQISDLNHTIDTDTTLNESQVDSFVSNNGYLTSGGDINITNINATGNITLGTNSSCFVLFNGGKMCGTFSVSGKPCTTLFSPDGTSKMEVCN